MKKYIIYILFIVTPLFIQGCYAHHNPVEPYEYEYIINRPSSYRSVIYERPSYYRPYRQNHYRTYKHFTHYPSHWRHHYRPRIHRNHPRHNYIHPRSHMKKRKRHHSKPYMKKRKRHHSKPYMKKRGRHHK